LFSFLLFLLPLAPRSRLFPYTTLFRSVGRTRLVACLPGLRPDPSRPHPLRAGVGDHDHLSHRGDPASDRGRLLPPPLPRPEPDRDRKSTRLNSSHVKISYAVFCLKKKR